MPRSWKTLALACLASVAHSQNNDIPSAGQIANIINSTGIVPANLVEAAGNLLAGIANTTQQSIHQALSKPGIDPQKLLNPELYYSYAHSPPVYPSPESDGDGDWAQAYQQAKALVAQMTPEEKNRVVIPAKDNRGCSGFIDSIPRLNFTGMCLQDGPAGVHIADDMVSGYPAGVSVSASWDRGLAWQRANSMGTEFKAKGINVALGPVVGPLGRMAMGGRNWEAFGNDPYLSGALVEPSIQGLQEHVIACVKHFIANEQETQRNPFLQGFLQPLGLNLNNSVSSNLDDRTMHELYLWPFYDAVRAGAGSVMCSYQRINNSYGCQNSKTLNGLLKTELGFQGFVLSDYYAQHTGIATANAGMDLVMPSDLYWGNNQLVTATKNGSMNSTRLDDMATRVLASWFKYAHLAKPGLNANKAVDARKSASQQVIMQAAVEGHVLVKNTNSALPLKKPKTLSVFGWDAPAGLNTSASDANLYLYGLANSRKYTDGSDFGDIQFLSIFASIAPIGTTVPAIALNGTMIVGGGSGAITPTTLISPLDGLMQQAAIDGTTIHHDFVSQNPEVQESDACLVFINAQSTEGTDRPNVADEYSDLLVNNVASKCPSTIVIIHNAGVRLVERWIDHPNVTATLFAHLPGQASGAALTEVLYGRQSPSGRLPYTVAKNESDYGSLLSPTYPDAENPQYAQSNFSEGVNIDYRHFIHHNITPRYEFGYGLTYTTFSYSNLSISQSQSVDRSLAPPDAGRKAPSGGLDSLYDVLTTVSATIKNTGDVAAAEVAQLYLGIPNSGVPKALRGFEKAWLQPGEEKTVEFPLRRRDLSVWDTGKQMWMLQEGSYEVMVGKSVGDIQMKDCFEVC